MEIRSAEELIEPDQRTLRFTPLGLSMAGPLTMEGAAAYQQEVIAGFDLVDAVPGEIHGAYERLRMVHSYGLMSYELFTIVHQQAPMVVDLALRRRFLDYYRGGGVPLVDAFQEQRRLETSSFDSVYESLNYGAYRKGGWELQLARGDSMVFKGSFSHLLRWARKVGLLVGQRNRRTDMVLIRIRNASAHPYGHSTLSPVDSARMIRETAEIINRLWGSTTPGGHLYPGPIKREILAVGWSPREDHRVQFRAWAGREDVDPSKTYVLLRAVEHDPGLMTYDSHFETTRYPVDLLWGPGTWENAEMFLRRARPHPDETDYLDRLFLIRKVDGQTERPRRPEAALALGHSEVGGTWYLIRADHPNDAFVHIRGPGGNTNPECAPHGSCNVCAVETIALGAWDDVVGMLDGVAPGMPPSVRVPSRWS